MDNYYLVLIAIILVNTVYSTDVGNLFRLIKPGNNITGIILDDFTVISKVECGER